MTGFPVPDGLTPGTDEKFPEKNNQYYTLFKEKIIIKRTGIVVFFKSYNLMNKTNSVKRINLFEGCEKFESMKNIFHKPSEQIKSDILLHNFVERNYDYIIK